MLLYSVCGLCGWKGLGGEGLERSNGFFNRGGGEARRVVSEALQDLTARCAKIIARDTRF